MMNWKHFVGLLAVVIGLGSTCPNGWVAHDDMCYHFSHDSEDFPGAMAMCKLIGGQLVEIENATEGQYLSSQVKGKKYGYWIGLTDLTEEGTWMWVNSKSPLTSDNYHNWNRGQPDNLHTNQNCALLDGTSGGLMADGACHGAHHFICESSDS